MEEFKIGDIVRVTDDHVFAANQVGVILGHDEESDRYLVKLGRYHDHPIKIPRIQLVLASRKASAGSPGKTDISHYMGDPEIMCHILNPGDGKETCVSSVKEAVNHPDHYQGPHECIEIMEAMFGKEAVKHFCMCNAFKYRFRAGMKNGEEDIEKAEWYEECLIKMGGIDNGM